MIINESALPIAGAKAFMITCGSNTPPVNLSQINLNRINKTPIAAVGVINSKDRDIKSGTPSGILITNLCLLKYRYISTEIRATKIPVNNPFESKYVVIRLPSSSILTANIKKAIAESNMEPIVYSL